MQLAALANLLASDGELYYWPRFYRAEKADAYFDRLYRELAWRRERLFIYGRWVNVPRLMAWYGDPSARYRYSGVDHRPLPWTADLQTLRGDVETICNAAFNSVLANLYRDGRDSMGCHADNEKELGQNPLIASLSFGDSRVLRFKHLETGQKLDLELNHGDLLVMAGELQHRWRHELPKTRKPKQPRINLTFRHIAA
ncbi:alpha-ketoglutarate-dependent dioxygenase AlkB family protein [Methylomonas rivi]|uniref:Alpha-ketoglutarate-dependent dioxygenase AlkB n=1 Tax=Methylomonas rivi TaxID=2952226 RepID=A0ABT1U069_9GAMM|nr:alpha-ketoglutarate-dependent dioxygenase AlkB [Methylomonas sp. WSC-6]MBS4052598.1 alpha-ketoglutarate-dependent dioxygenase AlkB [Methylomonas sp.]MCQ8127031.1 alpha-ketoglutarate-dependent dioxygenase AlkB [Methylomonas sp. WSC-6]